MPLNDCLPYSLKFTVQDLKATVVDWALRAFNMWSCCDNIQFSTVLCGRVCASSLSAWRWRSAGASHIMHLWRRDFVVKGHFQESSVGRENENWQW